MSRVNPQDFFEMLKAGAVLAGLDIGSKTIGLALGNLETCTVTPLKTLERGKFSRTITALKKELYAYSVDALVVGYPYHMSGEEGRACQSIRDFMAEAEKQGMGLPYIFQDERLSTEAVDGYLDKSVHKRNAKNKGLTDAIAASIILKNALDNYKVRTH